MGLIIVKIDDVFVLKETVSYNRGEYRIDDDQIISFADIKRYQFDHKPKVETIEHKHEIEAYEKGGDKLTFKEFQDTVREMYSKHVDEDGDWDSIDAEFAYRKWNEGWKPIYKDYDSFTEIDIPVVSQKKSEFKDITPLYQIGVIENPLCQYDPTPIAYISEFAVEMGLEEEELSYWGNHSGGKELKLYNRVDSNGTSTYKMYLGSSELPIEAKQFKGTYDECVTKRNEVRENIKKVMQRAYDEQVATLTQDKAQVVLHSLRSIRADVAGLNVYAKSRDSKHYLLRKIDDSIDTIVKSTGSK